MKRLVPIFLALLLLTGCARPLIPTEYTAVTEHSEAAAEQKTDALRAENYEELKYDILSFIESGVSHGVIHVYNYDGDVPADIPTAAYEVWKNDPIGAYAVEFITTDCNLLVSFYEIHVEITYRRSPAQVAAIEYVRGSAGVRSAIESALSNGRQSLALRVSAYDDALDCAAIVSDYCAANPESIMEEPSFTAAVYPDHGSVRILELDFSYEHSAPERASMRTNVSLILGSAVNYVRFREEEAARAELLYSYLMERFDYELGTTSTPLYSLLCEGIADSHTFALVFELLCERIGLECMTVHGYLDGEGCDWNIICIDGIYRHVDLLRGAREGQHELVYYTDEEMSRYSWDRETYPACEPLPEPVEPVESVTDDEPPENPDDPGEEPGETPDEPEEGEQPQLP